MTTGLDLLRVPFEAHHISYLPKGGVKLAYVGHAALTDRLLDADPNWTWEPLSMSPDGLPVFDGFGGMWIKLTVCGVTRLGYGHAGNKEGGDAIKEVIGDALRNAAMRFGAALDLWHKGELHKDEPKKDDVSHSGPAIAFSELQPDVQTFLRKATLDIIAAMPDAGKAVQLIEMVVDNYPDEKNEVKAGLWSLLDSKTRSAIKAHQKAL